MAEKVNFKKNRKPLPNAIILPLFLFVLGGLCALLLSLTNDLTKDKIKENDQKAAQAELVEIRELLAGYGLEKVNNVYDSLDNYIEEEHDDSSVKQPDDQMAHIDSLFDGVELLSGRGADSCYYEVANVFFGELKETSNPCLAFKVLHTNNFTTVTTLVVIKLTDMSVLETKVIGKATTLGSSKDKEFTSRDAGSWNVKGAKEDTYRSTFTIISGSTYSSKSVKNSIKYAFNQITASHETVNALMTLYGGGSGE